MCTTTYRWNAQQAAADYDAAGPVIHPLYGEVQAAVVSALPSEGERIVDLGGGSGRLAERILTTRSDCGVTIVEPSKPFLELARRRLERFGDQVRLVPRRAQEPWSDGLPRPDAIVSTSALHHLDGAEKNAVFAACHDALPSGGVFINGDEYRPPSDATYLEWLIEWGEHMQSALATGQIPQTFGPLLDKWRARNLDGFGGPRESGDDCHETIEEQIARLYGAGFTQVETIWKDRLWGVLVAKKG